MSAPLTAISAALEEAARKFGDSRTVQDADRRPALQIDYRDWRLTVDASRTAGQVRPAWRLRAPDSPGQLPLVAEGGPDGRDLPRVEC